MSNKRKMFVFGYYMSLNETLRFQLLLPLKTKKKYILVTISFVYSGFMVFRLECFFSCFSFIFFMWNSIASGDAEIRRTAVLHGNGEYCQVVTVTYIETFYVRYTFFFLAIGSSFTTIQFENYFLSSVLLICWCWGNHLLWCNWTKRTKKQSITCSMFDQGKKLMIPMLTSFWKERLQIANK